MTPRSDKGAQSWRTLRLLRRHRARMLGRVSPPLLIVFIIITLAVGGTTTMVMQEAQRRIIEHEAVKIAEIVARTALASRTVYSTEVAEKLTRDGFGPAVEFHTAPGYVPIPAQFLKLVGRESSRNSDGLYRYQPLSKWNLEPTQGLKDDFHRWGWAQLEAQDQTNPTGPIAWKPVWRFERLDSGNTLRYLRADSAATNACVGCHNAFEMRPEVVAMRQAAGVPLGKQWVEHQLLGAIEVQVPVSLVESLAEGQTRRTTVLVLGISFLGLVVASWFAWRDSRAKAALAMDFERQAKYDALTGLPNRSLLQDRSSEMIKRAARSGETAGVVFIDLDNFKNINDSLGHTTGDRVLRETAVRIASCLRQSDTVARYSGDEFVVLLSGGRDVNDMAIAVRKLIEQIAQPYRLADHDVIVSASVGIACFPNDGYDAETLLKNADAAMYRAKELGRNQYQFFSADMNAKALYKLGMTAKLRQAILKEELELFYQPKYARDTGEMCGIEALARWRHPEFGLITPDQFIGIAEETGLIEPLGEWALRKGLSQLAEWLAAGLSPGRLAVNVSVRQFSKAGFAEHVIQVLSEVGVDAKHLELEITETAVMREPAKVERVIAQLHEHGVSIAIDDFGVGQSSLSYLKRFRLSALKIDKSFIDGVPDEENDVAITRAVVALAKSLSLQVVAEGVENARQVAFLKVLGCDQMQGFFYSKPLSSAEMAALLRAPASA